MAQHQLYNPTITPPSSFVPYLAQTQITDITTNISGTSAATVPIAGATLINQDAYYTIDSVNHTITLPAAGRYVLSGNVALRAGISSNSARNNIRFFWQRSVNGGTSWSTIGGWYQNNYARDASGHNEISQSLQGYHHIFNAGDMVRLRSVRVAGAGGTETFADNTVNYIQIEFRG